MEYEKKTENFSFGFGTMKAAGSGSVSEAEEAPKNVRTRYDKKLIAKNAANAAIRTAGVVLKYRLFSDSKKKSNKKEGKTK